MYRIKYYLLFIFWNFRLYILKKKDFFNIKKEEVLFLSTKNSCVFFDKKFKFKYGDNLYYGNLFNIGQYIDRKVIDEDFIIEHGLYLHETIYPNRELKANRIITFSDFREKLYLAANIPNEIIKIGPYIHYSKDFYSVQQFHKIKKQLGKVLLVFPSHSIEGVESKYDLEDFTKKLEYLKEKYCINTIVVNLYWKDFLNRNLYLDYMKRGYRVTCVGYRKDPYFTSRLKTLIKLSDITVGNDIGTHLGYCIFYDKPHILIDQKTSYVGDRVEQQFNEVSRGDAERHRIIIKNTFSKDFETITEEQYNVVDYYWGLSHIKTPEEVKKILKIGLK